jgi:hypothetical protein
LPSGAIRIDREAGRFEQERKRDQVGHVIVHLEKHVLRENEEKHTKATQRVRPNEWAQQPLENHRHPEDDRKVHERAEAVTQKMAAQAHRHIGCGIERKPRGKEIAGEERPAAQRSFAVHEAEVEHIPGQIRQGGPQRVEAKKRQRDSKPEQARRPPLRWLLRSPMPEPEKRG